MDITQDKLNVLNQSIRNKKIKIELLDFNLKTIDTIESEIVSGSLTFNANNDIRRSGNIEMVIPLYFDIDTFLMTSGTTYVGYGGKIWLDKNVKIWVGIEDINIYPIEIVWYNMGIYLINQPTQLYTSTQRTISFECIDLMAKLSGLRNGYLTNLTTNIESDIYNSITLVWDRVLIKDVLISVLTELGGISKYNIDDIPVIYQYLPYDIKINSGGTVLDILIKIRDCIPNWEFFFDENGVFIFQPIPSGETFPVYPVYQSHIIQDKLSLDFQNVKNQIVVYGLLNDVVGYTEDVVYDTVLDVLKLYFTTFNTASLNIKGAKIAFKALSTTILNPRLDKLAIYSGGSMVFSASLVSFENSLSYVEESLANYKNVLIPNEIYVIRVIDAPTSLDGSLVSPFTRFNTTCDLYSKQQASGCIVNDNVDSPFYINRNISEHNYYCGQAILYESNGSVMKYNLKINSNDTEIVDNTIFTFYMPHINDKDETRISIINNENIPLVINNSLVDSSGDYISPNILNNDYTIYKIKYNQSNNTFVYLGRHTDALVQVFNDGEYANIPSDSLCEQRAEWELFLKSNLKDSIDLDIIPNYILDVNYKIPYFGQNINTMLNYKVIDGQLFVEVDGLYYRVKGDNLFYYLIKEITFPLSAKGDAQKINAIRIYDINE